MSENSGSFKFFSPLTTPIVARCRLAEQKKKEADFICNFSSDSDTSSIFITRSKAKGSEVIKQPKRQVIESIITSLDSVDSDSGSENLFAPNLKVTRHRKKKTKTIIQTPDLINSDLSDVYSGCQKSSPVKKSVVYADKTNKCSSHRKGIQSDKGKHLLSKLPVSINNLNLKGNASYHGNSSSSESKDNYAPGKSKLNKSRCRSSSESDLISNSNSSSDQTSESGSDEQKGPKNSPGNMQSQSPPKKKIKSHTQKEQGHKRISSSSDFESESDLDLDNNKSKPASTKVKISSTEQTSITATTSGSKDSPLKGKHLSGSKSVIDAVPDYFSESDSEGNASPIIQKQNIQRHITESQVISTVVATASPSSKTEAGRSKSTNHRRKVKRFQCPEGFEEVGNIGDTILPIKKSAKKEFWLIKTSWDFDIKNLDRATIPLAGSIRLPGTQGAKHFEVMAIPKSKEEVLKMGTLLADENLESLICGPSLAGQIHVIESSASLPLVEIQVQPKTRHQIPQDLKQRHVPFGAECPVWTIKTNGIAGEKKGEKRKHEEGEKRKEKKRKKKKKKIQGE